MGSWDDLVCRDLGQLVVSFFGIGIRHNVFDRIGIFCSRRLKLNRLVWSSNSWLEQTFQNLGLIPSGPAALPSFNFWPKMNGALEVSLVVVEWWEVGLARQGETSRQSNLLKKKKNRFRSSARSWSPSSHDPLCQTYHALSCYNSCYSFCLFVFFPSFIFFLPLDNILWLHCSRWVR